MAVGGTPVAGHTGAGTAEDTTRYTLESRRWGVMAALWLNLFLMWMCWFMQGPNLVSYWGMHQHVSFGSAEYLLSSVAIAGIPICLGIGYLHDRLGPWKATAISVVAITVGFGLRPLAVNDFSLMLVLTVVAGIGCVPLTMATVPVARLWFGHARNIALAVLFSAFALGQVVGLLAGAQLVSTFGATWAFAIPSLALLFSCLVWLMLVPHAPRQPAGPPPAKEMPLWQGLKQVVSAEASWPLFVVGGAFGAVSVFAGSFIPDLMTTEFHLSAVQGGDTAATFSAGAFVGMLVIGRLTHRATYLVPHGLWTALVQMASWLLLAITVMVGVMPLWGALLCLAAFGFCYQPCFSFGVNALERARGITPETVGLAAGFYFTGVSIGAYVLPTILAHFVDQYGRDAGLMGELSLFVMGSLAWGFAVLAPAWHRRRQAATADASEARIAISD